MNKALLVQELAQFRDAINNLFAGQFLYYENPGQFLPQSEMLREMLHLLDENRLDDMFAGIDKNIQHLEGFFFTTLSETMRNAHSRGDGLTHQALILIGRRVAGARTKHGLPCSFAGLWQI